MVTFFRSAFVTATLCFIVSAPSAFAQGSVLSEGDRQALMDRLKELNEGADSRASKRSGSALTAFRAAVGSDDRAHELYLSCVEQVRFENEKKSSQDFRNWKRRHKDREDSAGFRRVLRHQLNWLLLTIEAGSGVGDAELSAKVVKALDSIIGDSELEAGEFRSLEGDVTKTVFALAYGVRAPEDWPTSPLKLKEIYQMQILPPLAEAKNFESYRSAWTKWIGQEARLEEARSQSSEKGERSAAFERFLVEKRPQMLWDLEKSVFEEGDQKSGALGMIKHLETFAGHKNEVQWTKDFFEILKPKETAGE